MRAFFLLCITAAFTAVVMGDNCPSCNELSPEMKERLQKNGQTMNRLIARMLAVSDTVAKRKQDREQAETQAHNMLQRIERHNGICPDKFVCGGAAGQCVDNLVVCDGDDDCDNGADEADNICKPPAKEGDVWVGTFVYHNCSTHVFGELKFVLHSFKQKQDMKSLADVSAHLYWDDLSDPDAEHLDSLPYEGIYKFYSRTGVFKINYAGNIYKELFYFVPGADDVLHYDVHFANSGEICARAYLHRQ